MGASKARTILGPILSFLLSAPSQPTNLSTISIPLLSQIAAKYVENCRLK
jgi:hypothetical protein